MLKNEESIISWQVLYYKVAYVEQVHVSILLGSTMFEGCGSLIPTSKVVRQTYHGVSGQGHSFGITVLNYASLMMKY